MLRFYNNWNTEQTQRRVWLFAGYKQWQTGQYLTQHGFGVDGPGWMEWLLCFLLQETEVDRKTKKSHESPVGELDVEFCAFSIQDKKVYQTVGWQVVTQRRAVSKI